MQCFFLRVSLSFLLSFLNRTLGKKKECILLLVSFVLLFLFVLSVFEHRIYTASWTIQVDALYICLPVLSFVFRVVSSKFLLCPFSLFLILPPTEFIGMASEGCFEHGCEGAFSLRKISVGKSEDCGWTALGLLCGLEKKFLLWGGHFSFMKLREG